MELNNIKSSNLNWGDAANDLNQNFGKINNAIEQVKNVTTRNKGYFTSVEALKTAYPNGANLGDYGYVGTSYPFNILKWDGSNWYDTGVKGGENVELGNFYTKSETDGKFTETDAKLSELGSEVNLLSQEVANSEDIKAAITNVGRFVSYDYKGWTVLDGINVCSCDVSALRGKKIRIQIKDVAPSNLTMKVCYYIFNKGSITSSSDYFAPMSRGYLASENVGIDDIVIVPDEAKYLVLATTDGTKVGDVPTNLSVSVLEGNRAERVRIEMQLADKALKEDLLKLGSEINKIEKEITLLGKVDVSVTSVGRYISSPYKAWSVGDGINICAVNVVDFRGKEINVQINDVSPNLEHRCFYYIFNSGDLYTSSGYIEPTSASINPLTAISVNDKVVVPENAVYLVVSTTEGTNVGDKPSNVEIYVNMGSKIDELYENLDNLREDTQSSINEIIETLSYKEKVNTPVSNIGRFVSYKYKSWTVYEGINLCAINVSDIVGKEVEISINDIAPSEIPNSLFYYVFNKGDLTVPSDYIEPSSGEVKASDVVNINANIVVPSEAKYLVLATTEGTSVGHIPSNVSFRVLCDKIEEIEKDLVIGDGDKVLDVTASSSKKIDDSGVILSEDLNLHRIRYAKVQKGATIKVSSLKVYDLTPLRIAMYEEVPKVGESCISGTYFESEKPKIGEVTEIVYQCKFDGYVCVYGYGLGHNDYWANLKILINNDKKIKDVVKDNVQKIKRIESEMGYPMPNFIGIPISCHTGVTASGMTLGSPRAWKVARDMGYKWLECDIQFTKDNKAVFLHDNPINSNGNYVVDASGNPVAYEKGSSINLRVSDLTLEELKQYHWRDGGSILSLVEGFGLLNQFGMNCQLEFKAVPSNEEQKLYVKNACIQFGCERIIYNATSTPYRTIFDMLISLGIYRRGIVAVIPSNEADIEDAFAYAKKIGNAMVNVYDSEMSYSPESSYIQEKLKEYGVQYYWDNWGKSNSVYQVAHICSNYIVPVREVYKNEIVLIESSDVDYTEYTSVGSFTITEPCCNVNLSVLADEEVCVNVERFGEHLGNTNIACVMKAGTYNVYVKGKGKINDLLIRW